MLRRLRPLSISAVLNEAGTGKMKNRALRAGVLSCLSASFIDATTAPLTTQISPYSAGSLFTGIPSSLPPGAVGYRYPPLARVNSSSSRCDTDGGIDSTAGPFVAHAGVIPPVNKRPRKSDSLPWKRRCFSSEACCLSQGARADPVNRSAEVMIIVRAHSQKYFCAEYIRAGAGRRQLR